MADPFNLMSSYPNAASAKAALDEAPAEAAAFAKARIDALPASASINVHVSVSDVATLVHVFCVPTPEEPAA